MEPRQNFLKLEEQYSLAVYPKRDLVIVAGKGSLVKDETGKEYIDCTAGHGVAGVGHGNEAVIQAITRQARRLITCSGTFYNDTRALLLEKLVSIAPAGLNRVFLCNSGTQAVEAALKLARLTTGKTDFICAVKGFHGRTMGALSATYNPKYKTEFLPLVPGFHFVPFNNISPLIKQVEENPDRFAGIILEPVQGEGGVHIGRQDYFREVRAICDERGIMLIIDEVQTGFGRTGRMFGLEHFDIPVDMMCVAKTMAGGVPMGAVLCAPHIREAVGKHGSTFGGNPLACAAASAVIDFIKENRLPEQAAEKGCFLLEKLRRIKSAKIREVRGLGLMIGIELKEKVTPYIQALVNEGVLTLPAGSTVLRLLPPLVIDYNQLETVVEKIQKVL